MKKRILFSFLILSLALVFSGCGKSVSEKATEIELEKSLGSNADVDLEDDKVTVDTEEGSWQAGKDVDKPDNWPEDVHVIDGKITSASETDMGYSLTLETDKTVDDVKKDYDVKLASDGWVINNFFNIEGSIMLGATKDERTLSINISADENKTLVVIFVANNKK